MVDEPTQPPQPLSIANYRLGRVIGQGGWGIVYEAVNTRNDERVALKLLHAHLADDEAYRERFQREAQVATLLRSPYTVHLLDFGVDAGRHFLVMNFVEGEVLSEIVKAGPLPPARAFKIASQVALALEEAEARGVVHRDIKPDNVIVTPEESVRVLDFGIARQAGRATLTQTGAFIGTLTYAAPEAAEGQVDHRSDLYSLGATLFHMLTGQPPFVGEMIQLLRHHRETPVPRRLLEGLPEEAVSAVLRLLEKMPDDRYQTASETAGVLERLSMEATRRADAPLEMEATELLGGTADTSLITMALQPSGRGRRFVPRASVTTYELRFQNDGSQEMTLQLDAADPSDSCQIMVPETVAVPARSDTTVKISIAPRRRRWVGRAEQRPFRVTASGEGGGPPIVAVGEFEDRPQGVVPVAGGALFGLGLLAVLAVFLLGGGGGQTTDSAPLPSAFAPVPGGSLDDQGTLRVDTTSAGAIAEPDEVDLWTFFAAAGQVMTVGVEATDGDSLHPYIELAIPDGPLLAFVAGEDGEAWLDGVRFAAAGQYVLRVRSFDVFNQGGYTIELYDEPADSVLTLTDAEPGDEELPIDGVSFASLNAAQSVDWTFSGEAGEVMSVGVESYLFAPFDPFVELIAPDGASLGRDGAIGSGYGWLDEVSLPQSGVYTVRVSTLGGAGGMYGVVVETSEAAAAVASPTPSAEEQSGVTASGTQGTTLSQALRSALASIGGNRPRAVVGSEGAIFFIPINPGQNFSWDLASSDANAQEHQWLVQFTLANTTFVLAMSQTKEAGESPQGGTLDRLVDASTVNLLRQAESGKSTVLRNAGPLFAVAAEEGLVLAIADAQYVSGLRQQQPEQVRFVARGTLRQSPSQVVVDIVYVESLAALPSFGDASSTATATSQPTTTASDETSSFEPPVLTGGAAVVLNREVRFLFALDPHQTFRWNEASTRDNVMDLMWAVELPLDDKSYEFRLMHFKRAGSTPVVGDLEAFLNEAQLNVWELTDGGRSTALRTIGLSASVVPGGLELVLGDPGSVKLLREERPATLTLIAGGASQPRHTVVATLQYEDSGPP